jgi:putative transposase
VRILAEERRRWGYQRLHVLLRREGFVVNHKRVYRLYREEGLMVRRRRRKRISVPRLQKQSPTEPQERWSMDFISDALCSGRRFRSLTIVDDFTREAAAIEVDTSLPAARVIAVLERLERERGLPRGEERGAAGTHLDAPRPLPVDGDPHGAARPGLNLTTTAHSPASPR